MQDLMIHRNRREEKERARPGIIMVVQSFGAGLKIHVHFHILVSVGVYFPDGSYFALGIGASPCFVNCAARS